MIIFFFNQIIEKKISTEALQLKLPWRLNRVSEYRWLQGDQMGTISLLVSVAVC